MRNSSYTLMAIACGLELAAGHDSVKAQVSGQTSCQEIAVLGAVKQPGRFKFARRIRLIEVLAYSGRPSERAGKIVRVVRTCACTPCLNKETKAAESSDYELSAVLQGREGSNRELAPGDMVIIPERELVFVIGNVFQQKSLVYREGMTLTRAIAIVGGVAKNSDLVQIRIYRDSSTRARSNPLIFTLKAVLRNRNEDPVLQPRDIIQVSDEAGNFQRPFTPPIWDPPLIRPSGDPPLFLRKSSNC
jgi:protein involved in polysaccharide export with SLBB domain